MQLNNVCFVSYLDQDNLGVGYLASSLLRSRYFKKNGVFHDLSSSGCLYMSLHERHVLTTRHLLNRTRDPEPPV